MRPNATKMLTNTRCTLLYLLSANHRVPGLDEKCRRPIICVTISPLEVSKRCHGGSPAVVGL
jgi:hypothetical protein